MTTTEAQPQPIVANVEQLTLGELKVLLRFMRMSKAGTETREDLLAVTAVLDRIVVGGIFERDVEEAGSILAVVYSALVASFAEAERVEKTPEKVAAPVPPVRRPMARPMARRAAWRGSLQVSPGEFLRETGAEF